MNTSRLKLLLSFLEKAPRDAFTLYSIAHEYWKQGDSQQALSYFEQLLDNQPDYLGTYYHYGKLLLQLEQQAKAEDVFRKGIKMADHQKDTHTAAELRSALSELEDWD